LPPVGAISKHPGVSADAVAKPSAQTRAESRVLVLGAPVVGLRENAEGVTLDTPQRTYRARYAIIAP
jgi:hypothetical protein